MERIEGKQSSEDTRHVHIHILLLILTHVFDYIAYDLYLLLDNEM